MAYDPIVDLQMCVSTEQNAMLHIWGLLPPHWCITVPHEFSIECVAHTRSSPVVPPEKQQSIPIIWRNRCSPLRVVCLRFGGLACFFVVGAATLGKRAEANRMGSDSLSVR